MTDVRKALIERALGGLKQALAEANLDEDVSSKLVLVVQDENSQVSWASVFQDGQMMQGAIQTSLVAIEAAEFVKLIETEKARLRLGRLMVHNKW